MPDISRVLDRINQSTNRDELLTYRENATRMGATEAAEACNRRLGQLQHGRYLGAFANALVGHVSREPGRALRVTLHLANDQQGTPRGTVEAEIHVDPELRITIRDMDTGSYDSSLSDLRAVYGEKGGGTDSWSSFKLANNQSIAEYLGVDPADAQASRGSGVI